jgi:hypothetical protein
MFPRRPRQHMLGEPGLLYKENNLQNLGKNFRCSESSIQMSAKASTYLPCYPLRRRIELPSSNPAADDDCATGNGSTSVRRHVVHCYCLQINPGLLDGPGPLAVANRQWPGGLHFLVLLLHALRIMALHELQTYICMGHTYAACIESENGMYITAYPKRATTQIIESYHN